jgi:tetratricopeptide (TPR) repeat protein
MEAGTEEPAQESIPEPEMPKDIELPSWLEGLEPAEEKREANLSAEEALEWKDDGLPDWLIEITEEVPSEATPPLPVAPFIEEVTEAPAEAIEEWTSEEVPITDLDEEKVEAPVEPLAEELPWVPESQDIPVPVTEERTEPEVEPASINEGVTKTLGTSPVPLAEVLVPPVAEPTLDEFAGLEDARNAINQGLPTQAAELYTGIIKQNRLLEEVIKDLQDALYRFPVDVDLWVAFGDAHFRMDNLQEALNDYTKAEDLVR